MSTPKSDSSVKSSESVGSYCFIRDHQPRNGNYSSPDFLPDAKWWLNHYGLETETYGDIKLIEGYCHPDSKNDPAFRSEPLKHFISHDKSNGDSWLLGIESVINNSDLLPNAHLTGLDSCNRVLCEQPEKLLDSHWIGVEKTEPWWHAVDKDKIAASLTSQNSFHHEKKNCDHPDVQPLYVEKVSENCKCCFGQCEEKMMDKQRKSLGKQGQPETLLQESVRSCRSKDWTNAAEVDSSDTRVPNGDLNRGQLLEALCHSQTRAREAEKLAQEACDDKDHVINLFFQQASCLFAYRQWLHLLQLETLCLRLRSKDGITSLAPPPLLPWAGSKAMNSRKNRSRAGKKKADEQRFDGNKSALAVAIGLGLVGAGLLVGWTIGWFVHAL